MSACTPRFSTYVTIRACHCFASDTPRYSRLTFAANGRRIVVCTTKYRNEHEWSETEMNEPYPLANPGPESQDAIPYNLSVRASRTLDLPR